MLGTSLLVEIDTLERNFVEKLGLDAMIGQLDRVAQAIDERTRYEYESFVAKRVANSLWSPSS